MQESVASWSAAVFAQGWEEGIQLSPAPLERRVVAAALYDGATYLRQWHDAVRQPGETEQPGEAVFNRIDAEENRLQEAA